MRITNYSRSSKAVAVTASSTCWVFAADAVLLKCFRFLMWTVYRGSPFIPGYLYRYFVQMTARIAEAEGKAAASAKIAADREWESKVSPTLKPRMMHRVIFEYLNVDRTIRVRHQQNGAVDAC